MNKFERIEHLNLAKGILERLLIWREKGDVVINIGDQHRNNNTSLNIYTKEENCKTDIEKILGDCFDTFIKNVTQECNSLIAAELKDE